MYWSRIITIDAIGTQKEISKQIRNQNGDYILEAKENQKGLYCAIKVNFDDKENLDNLDGHEEWDNGHGRIEKRVCYTLDCHGKKIEKLLINFFCHFPFWDQLWNEIALMES